MSIKNLWIGFDYGVFLPSLAFLPYKWGRSVASFRGHLYSLIKRDWRSFTFGDEGLWERTYKAYEEICPNLSHDERLKLVQKRYMYQSIEEFEGALLDKDKFSHIKVKYIGIERVEEQIAKNPHAVFVTSHFGSSLLGITLLKRLNIPLLVMSSNVVTHEKVHPTLTQFFLEKYRGIGRYMNGGEVLDIEGNGKKFLSFLKKRGSLVIIADLPPNNPNEIPAWKMFFGQIRGFASGAEKLAQSTKSEIIPFVCYFEDDNYVVKFGDFNKEPYSFLEQEIQKKPEMWWAADILKLLPTKQREQI
ncbi:MAG: hypothetical protein NTZ60_00085 [Campylobacterales bacterium]|nr:hypothetical protein [Campylobacterales bacterium]